MLTKYRIKVVAAAFALTVSVAANAQLMNFTLGGTQVTDVWSNLTNSGVTGGGSMMSPKTWTPLASQSGGGDALFVKISNGSNPAFGPYPGSGSMYFGAMTGVANTYGGTVQVNDLTPVSGLQTLLFQITIGGAYGYDFYNNTQPSLQLTLGGGATLTLAADYNNLVDRYQNGSRGDEPIYISTYGLQWDLSAYNNIESFSINIDAVQHAQLYALRLDQSDAASGNLVGAIPEPSTCALTVSGALLLAWLARRRELATREPLC